MVHAVTGYGEGISDRHGVGVAEVQPLHALGHHDREASVGREVEVVGVFDRDGRTGFSRRRVDGDEVVAQVVGRVQRLQVVGRDDVLGLFADGEVADDLHRPGVDDVNGVGPGVGDVDESGEVRHHGAQEVRAVRGVDVPGVLHGGHAGQDRARDRPGDRRPGRHVVGEVDDLREGLPARAGRSQESHEDEPEGSRREQRPPHGLRLQDREEKRPSEAAGKRLGVSNSSQSPAEMPQVMPDSVMRP